MENEVTEETPIDDELGAIFDEANAEETVAEVVADEGPALEPDGKFAAKETEAPAEAASEEIQADPGAETEVEAVEQSLDAPASWTAAEKAHWPSLTRELQESFLRREGDWQKADSERANQLKGLEPIAAALEPVRQNLELNGVPQETYVRQLVSADQYLRTNPNEAIQWLAQQYGVDLGQINAGQPDVDPYTAPLVQEITQLKAQQEQFFEAQRQTEIARQNAVIDAFAAEHPHFETVVDDITRLVQANPGMDLPKAYEQAVWANPTTRAQMIAEQSAEAERKRTDEASKRAATAKRVSNTNLTSKGTAAGSTPPQYSSLDEELDDAYERAQGA